MLTTHAFRLRASERLISGLATGMLLFIGLGNLLSNLLPEAVSFWAAALLVLAGGMLAARRSAISKRRPWLDWRDLRAWPALLALLILTMLFQAIQSGLAIFDEYLHIPLVSTMAAGDIPPHFYLNPDTRFAYHYGIQVYAASLVRLGDFFPWSAWDLSRAIAIAFTLVLGWIWVRRVTGSRLAAWLGSFAFTFAGGTRWLLLLLPASWRGWLDAGVHLANTGKDTAAVFSAALQGPWIIEGGGQIPFPFAFHSGFFVPVMFALGSTGAMLYMTILLLLLLLPRPRFSPAGLIIWSLLFATLALSAEHLFAAIWTGIALVGGYAFLQRQRKAELMQWGFVLLASAILAAIQGGFVTETLRGLLLPLLGQPALSNNAYDFNLRWPPAIPTAHTEPLSIFDARQLVALLAEMSPVLLLAPAVIILTVKKIHRISWFWSGLSISAILSVLFALFIRYGVDRSMTRMPATALWTWLVLGFPLLWKALPRLRFARLGVALGYILTLTAGVVIFVVQLANIPVTQYTYFIDALDAGFCADYWGELPPGAQVLDHEASRAPTIFGRIPRAHAEIYIPLPEWEALIANPDPVRAAQAGFDYVYLDKAWWVKLTSAQQETLMQPCVDIIEERKSTFGYRLLLDISACRLR